MPLTGLPTGRCLVVGVVNVTPDSFSDGGLFLGTEAAVAHGLDLLAEGADVVDVGGESTRPGAVRVDVDEELRRVVPVVRELAAAGAFVSVDTTRADVAAAALDAGARVVNDVSGGTADPAMRATVAAADAAYVVMHSRGPSNAPAEYADVAAEVLVELLDRLDAAVAAGVEPSRVVLDPGFGFSKRPEHNLALLAALPDLVVSLPCPVLVGTSRKAFLGHLLGGRDVGDRDAATQATTALAAVAGVWGVRVHAVRAAADAVRVVAAVRQVAEVEDAS